MIAELCISSVTEMPSATQLAAFVKTHARGGVIDRDASVFADALNKGVVTAVRRQELPFEDEGSVLGIAAVLPLQNDLFEMGGALVRRDATGFGLQRPMLAARLAVYLGRKIAPLSRLVSAASRAEYGAGSRALIEKAGFVPVGFDDGAIEFRDACLTCSNSAPPGERCCYQYYRAGPGCLDVPYLPGVVESVRRRDNSRLTLTQPVLDF
jgi:hypothetical protein